MRFDVNYGLVHLEVTTIINSKLTISKHLIFNSVVMVKFWVFEWPLVPSKKPLITRINHFLWVLRIFGGAYTCCAAIIIWCICRVLELVYLPERSKIRSFYFFCFCYQRNALTVSWLTPPAKNLHLRNTLRDTQLTPDASGRSVLLKATPSLSSSGPST